MKILMVADKIHKTLYDYFDKERWNDIDLILSAGDLKPKYLSFLVTMVKGAPVLYVRGNHDHDYKINPPLGCENIHGKIIDFQGLTILGLEGSVWYNGKGVQYREWEMWWEYTKVWPQILFKKNIDIILTHNPPFGLHDGTGFAHRGFKVFRYLIDKYEPQYFIHGHQHLSYSKQKRKITYKNTQIINAYEYHILEVNENKVE